MPELSPDDAAAIGHAGALLDMVGRGALGDASLASVHCLQATNLLASVAPLPDPAGVPMHSADAVVAIGEALRLLSTLSAAAFALPTVVEAVDAAQRARLATAR